MPAFSPHDLDCEVMDYWERQRQLEAYIDFARYDFTPEDAPPHPISQV